jgi:hypothetical protein
MYTKTRVAGIFSLLVCIGVMVVGAVFMLSTMIIASLGVLGGEGSKWMEIFLAAAEVFFVIGAVITSLGLVQFILSIVMVVRGGADVAKYHRKKASAIIYIVINFLLIGFFVATLVLALQNSEAATTLQDGIGAVVSFLIAPVVLLIMDFLVIADLVKNAKEYKALPDSEKA